MRGIDAARSAGLAVRINTVAMRGVNDGELPALLAWCGERFPSWAYFLKWDEVDVPFEWNGAKASVRYRVVGDATRETGSGVPPVLVAAASGEFRLVTQLAGEAVGGSPLLM